MKQNSKIFKPLLAAYSIAISCQLQSLLMSQNCFPSSPSFERARQNPHPQEQNSGPSTRTSYTRTGPAIPQTTSTTPLPPLLAPPSEFTKTIISCLSDATGPDPTLTIHRRTHRIFRDIIDPAPHGSTRRYGRGAKLLQAEPKRSGPDPAKRGPPCYRRRRVLDGLGFVMVGVGSLRSLGILEGVPVAEK